MVINIEDVKKLKELTGAGLTDAKAALEANKGDFKAALSDMRKKGLNKVEKRASRETRAGLIGTYNHDGRIGVVVEVNCETDFVARNDKFVDLTKELCLQIAATNPLDTQSLLDQPYIKDESKTVDQVIKETAALVGENLIVRRFNRLELGLTDEQV